MLSYIRSLIFVCALITGTAAWLFPSRAMATHAAGSDLTYTCLGGLVYQVEATFYRDCAGSNEPSSVTIRYGSASCGFSLSAVASKMPAPNGSEITMPCVGMPTSCNGGVTTGLRKWVYRAVVTLPMACSDWLFSYKVCCRNCTITTIQSPCATGNEIYVESRLNNIAAPGNSSPYFGTSPIAIMPIGQPFNYNQSVTDPDGDSLAYELITPMTSATSTVTWLGQATTQAPLASSTPFYIDQLTGDIRFTPSMLQIGILAVKVSEFRNGQFIGSTIRDMQVYTYTSTNTVPAASGINGTASHVMHACAGQPICFTIQTTDADSAQLLSAFVNSSIPGAVISVSSGPRPVVNFCWTADSSMPSNRPWIFNLTVRDNACPVNGIQVYSYAIYLDAPQIEASVVSNTCAGDSTGSVQVVSADPGTFTAVWNTVPPAQTPILNNLSGGMYIVTVTDANGCQKSDTATVSEYPSTDVQVTGNQINCFGVCSGSVNAVAMNGTPPYSWEWSNGQTTQNISGLCEGLYTVSVSDVNGCTSENSFSVQTLSTIQVTGTAIQPQCTDSVTGSININVAGGV
jgi:hypothetical protein